jgi:hypothetical protein
MANLGQKNGIYNVRFRYGGKEYKKSLRTRDEADAKAAVKGVEQTIHLLTQVRQLRWEAGFSESILGGNWLPGHM